MTAVTLSANFQTTVEPPPALIRRYSAVHVLALWQGLQDRLVPLRYVFPHVCDNNKPVFS